MSEQRHDPTQWREVFSTNPGDYYADTIRVSPEGWIQVSAGGKVCGRTSVRDLVKAIWPDDDKPKPAADEGAASVPLCRCEHPQSAHYDHDEEGGTSCRRQFCECAAFIPASEGAASVPLTPIEETPEWKAAKIRAYRQARVFEPSMDGYAGAMAVYRAAFGNDFLSDVEAIHISNLEHQIEAEPGRGDVAALLSHSAERPDLPAVLNALREKLEYERDEADYGRQRAATESGRNWMDGKHNGLNQALAVLDAMLAETPESAK